jgi:hypothetical protein
MYINPHKSEGQFPDCPLVNYIELNYPLRPNTVIRFGVRIWNLGFSGSDY